MFYLNEVVAILKAGCCGRRLWVDVTDNDVTARDP